MNFQGKEKVHPEKENNNNLQRAYHLRKLHVKEGNRDSCENKQEGLKQNNNNNNSNYGVYVAKKRTTLKKKKSQN